MKVTKRDGHKENFDYSKIYSAVDKAFKACDMIMPDPFKRVLEKTFKEDNPRDDKGKLIPLTVETIQDRIQTLLYEWDFRKVYDAYLLYRYEHKMTREYVKSQKDFIRKYMRSDNNANATVDDNSNVSCKNIGTLNVEAHKEDNIKTSRGMIMDKLKELFPEFNHKQYIKDLEGHIVYKHDESSFSGPIAPYCVSGTMYPFLTGGIRGLGGLSASPNNLDSFCGIYINWIFAMSSQFAGAVATPEFFVCFDYYARKEWGDDYYLRTDEVITAPQVRRQMTIGKQIEQYFQQVVYSINQPTAARGMQSAFVNFAYFDKYFFEGMFSHFRFPDGTEAPWENIKWLQKTFMKWFNKERLRTVMTFPVESFALVYKDGKFLDEDSADFVAEEYAEGHSFFTYMSDTVDSLSSCCFEGSEVIKVYDKNKQPFLTSIADFVNHNNPEISSKGNHDMKDLYYIESYTLSGKKELTPITGTLKKKYTGTMFTFEIGDGRMIKVTEDHELMVRNERGDIISLPARDVAMNPSLYELVVD